LIEGLQVPQLLTKSSIENINRNWLYQTDPDIWVRFLSPVQIYCRECSIAFHLWFNIFIMEVIVHNENEWLWFHLKIMLQERIRVADISSSHCLPIYLVHIVPMNFRECKHS
jgi:hypothetical protein